MKVVAEGYVDLGAVTLGDTVEVTVSARVTAMREELVDVTPMGARERQVVPGEVSAELLIVKGVRRA